MKTLTALEIDLVSGARKETFEAAFINSTAGPIGGIIGGAVGGPVGAVIGFGVGAGLGALATEYLDDINNAVYDGAVWVGEQIASAYNSAMSPAAS